MTESAGKAGRFGIGIKISIICGIIVLVLLAVGSFALLRFEYSLTKFFENEYIQKIESAIEEQGEKQRQLLKNRYKVNAEIAAGIAAPFVFNLDDSSIGLALDRYMELDEMRAITVLDEDGAPFFAMWKDAGKIARGTALPETVSLDTAFAATADSFVHEEKVGHVEIYYTDDLMAGQIAAGREKARKEIEEFGLIIDRRIARAFITQIISVVGVILVLVASIVASLHYVVLAPMRQCLHFAQRMSGGDFAGRLAVHRRDEIGILADALNHMSVSLGKVLAQISEGMKSLAASSAKLLATARELSSGSEELTVQAGAAADATEKINDNIYMVTSTAETMSVQSRDIASATREMSADVNSVAASIEEMSASIHEVAQNCSKVQAMAEQAQGTSHNAEKKVTELHQAARDIGRIIDVIENITEEIKLLALNATIEAARSGEAGKGFTVVADEVKSLAQQTARATKDIARQIGGIQDRTSSVVADIQEVAVINSQFNDHAALIASTVGEQNATTAEIARIVGGVARSSDNVSNLVETFSLHIEQDVVSALKEASSEVDRVAGNNKGVNTVARETAQAAGSINAAAGELSRLANELQQQVGRFRTA